MGGHLDGLTASANEIPGGHPAERQEKNKKGGVGPTFIGLRGNWTRGEVWLGSGFEN